MTNIIDALVDELFSNQTFADEYPVHATENYCSSFPDETPSLEEFKVWMRKYDADNLVDMLARILAKYKTEIADAVTEYIYDPTLFEEVNAYWHEEMDGEY